MKKLTIILLLLVVSMIMVSAEPQYDFLAELFLLDRIQSTNQSDNEWVFGNLTVGVVPVTPGEYIKNGSDASLKKLNATTVNATQYFTPDHLIINTTPDGTNFYTNGGNFSWYSPPGTLRMRLIPFIDSSGGQGQAASLNIAPNTSLTLSGASLNVVGINATPLIHNLFGCEIMKFDGITPESYSESNTSAMGVLIIDQNVAFPDNFLGTCFFNGTCKLFGGDNNHTNTRVSFLMGDLANGDSNLSMIPGNFFTLINGSCFETDIYLPASPGAGLGLYVGDDGSTYYDISLQQLAQAPKSEAITLLNRGNSLLEGNLTLGKKKIMRFQEGTLNVSENITTPTICIGNPPVCEDDIGTWLTNGTAHSVTDLNATNITATNQIITPRVRFRPSNRSYIKLGDIEDWGGSSEAFVFGNNEPDVMKGDIVFLLYAQENLTGLVLQSGLNNSAGIWGNSMMIMPNDMALNFFSKNLTNASNCLKVYSKFNKTPFFNCDTKGYGATLLVHGGIDVWRQLRVREGLIGSGTFDFNLKGNDAAFFGGTIHNQIPVNFTTGFNESQERNTINEGFDGILGIFVNDVTNNLDWFVTPQTQPVNLCDDEQCAKAIGGLGDVIMNTTFSTLNLNDTTLNFVYSLVGLIGADSFTVETNNNSGTGWEIQLDDGGTDTLNSQVIELGSDYWDASSVSIRVTCGATKSDRDCYIDSVRVNGTQTITTTEDQTGFDLELCAADCSRGTDGRPTRALIYSAADDKWLFNGNVNFTGTVVGGAVSGSGSANTIPKWSGSTTLIDSNIIDDGSTISLGSRTKVDGDLNVTGNLNVTGTAYLGGNVGIGTTTPDSLLQVNGSVNLNNTLIVTSTGLVGIGTSNPQKPLHILGSEGVVDNFPSSLGANDFLVIENDGSANIALIGNNVSGVAIKAYNNASADFRGLINYVFANDYWRFGTSGRLADMVIDKDGNVGIGTASPTTPLDIVCGSSCLKINSTAPDIFLLENDGSADENWGIRNTGGILKFQTADDDGGTRDAKLNILQNGNVGIGTASPTHKLNVVGTGNFTERVLIGATGDVSGDEPLIVAATTKNNLAVFESGDATANILFKEPSMTGSKAIGVHEDKFRIFVNDDAAITIDNDKQVGIGTASPEELLEIEGDSGGQGGTANPIRLEISDTSTGSSWDLVNPFSSVAFKSGDGSGPGSGIRAEIGTVMSHALGSITRLGFFTAPVTAGTMVEQMTILDTGNVGIGNTNPGAKLDVAGNMIVDANGSFGRGSLVAGVTLLAQRTDAGTNDIIRCVQGGTGDCAIGFALSTGTDYMMGVDNDDGDKFKIAQSLATLSQNTRLTIDTSGNVGLGTATPGAKLEVNGNINVTGVISGTDGSVIIQLGG